MDIPNAFIQTEQTGEAVHMKIWGKLAEILADMFPEVYKLYIVIEKGQMTLYVKLLKALYGTLMASLYYYHKWTKDLKAQDTS